MGLPVAARCSASSSRVRASCPAGTPRARGRVTLACGRSGAAGSGAAARADGVDLAQQPGPTSLQPISSTGPIASTRAVPYWWCQSAPAVFSARVSRPQKRRKRCSLASCRRCSRAGTGTGCRSAAR